MKHNGACDSPGCDALLPALAIAFCPFCGTRQTRRQMPEAALHPAAVPASEPEAAPVSGGGGAEAFEAHVAAAADRSYCDSGTYRALVKFGTGVCQLSETRADTLLAMQLERLHVVNETKVLGELEGLLRTFTDGDKKLDKKEWNDAVQSVCVPRPGYERGLDHAEAERAIRDYCRRNQVRVKVGMFKWEVP